MEIHRRAIVRFGGSPGARDLGLLDSALHRPQTGYYETLPQRAAALFDSLLLNHPFIDGNKRAALFITDAFLRMNGYKLAVETREAHRFILSYLESTDRQFTELVGWIEKHLRELS